MNPITVTSPDKTNWKLFCQEPPLTEVEQAIWQQMAQLYRQNEAFVDYCAVETATEWAAGEANSLLPRTKDWTDVVRWADAYRALKRAEIKAYQKWRRGNKEESCQKS